MLSQAGEMRLRMVAAKQHVVAYMIDQMHIDPMKAQGLEMVLVSLAEACRETSHLLNEITSELRLDPSIPVRRFYFEE